MRYISDDNKVFNTKQECCEHEQRIRKAKEDERIQREKLEFERKTLMDQICQKRKEIYQTSKELSELTQIYYDKFGVTLGEYLPFGEFLKILRGI